MKLKVAITTLLGVMALGSSLAQAARVAPGEWYVRLILQTDNSASAAQPLVDRYNLLGQLHRTVAGADSRDLPELGQTWAGTYLSVIFYRPEWGADKVDYNTDFHPIATGAADEWTFEVRSDDPARDLTLSWKGNQADFAHMVLVDVEENIVVPAQVNGKKQVYRFRMNGPVRQFSWRLLTRQQYRAFLASGALPPGQSPATPAADARMAGAAPGATPPATRTARPDSGWLPLGWDQGERAGAVPAGLPADPFGD